MRTRFLYWDPTELEDDDVNVYMHEDGDAHAHVDGGQTLVCRRPSASAVRLRA
jgi:hypothetical protein